MSDPDETVAPRRNPLEPDTPEQVSEMSPDGVELAQAAGASGDGSTEGISGPAGPNDDGGGG
jgi:hypothetical protein